MKKLEKFIEKMMIKYSSEFDVSIKILGYENLGEYNGQIVKPLMQVEITRRKQNKDDNDFYPRAEL